MERTLRLIEDVLPPAVAPVFLPGAARAIYIVEGEATIEFADGAQQQPADTAWLGGGPAAIAPGPAGARLWRWELAAAEAGEQDGLAVAAPGVRSAVKLSARIALPDGQDWLMRCDSVAFPPGGTAWTHVHQGPGIRCCLHGEIAIVAAGHTRRYGLGEAWLERGHEPVLAPTTEREATRFIRCCLLPRACRGRSSIRYVLADDADKPKRQTYRVFGERFVAV